MAILGVYEMYNPRLLSSVSFVFVPKCESGLKGGP